MIKDYFHILIPEEKEVIKQKQWMGRIEEIVKRVREVVKEDLDNLLEERIKCTDENLKATNGKVDVVDEKMNSVMDMVESVRREQVEMNRAIFEIKDMMVNMYSYDQYE